MMTAVERAHNSVIQEFDNFRSKIEPSEKETSAISSSHLKMRSILENSTDVKVLDTFLTGSYARQTIIKPLKDVDFFVQVHYGDHKNDTPLQLLNKIRKVLWRAYPLTTMTITPPCITVKFNYCNFEVVPAIGITNSEQYKISSDKGNGWQYVFPKVPDKWMISENKKASGLFKPTIKMLKRWRDFHEVPLRSFHLEMLVKMAFERFKIENYPQGVWAFFQNTNELFETFKFTPFVQEPDRNNEYVDQYLYNNRPKLIITKRKLNVHSGYAQRAFDYVSKGQAGSAKRLWRAIFGSSFYPTSAIPTMPPAFLSPRIQPTKPIPPPFGRFYMGNG